MKRQRSAKQNFRKLLGVRKHGGLYVQQKDRLDNLKVILSLTK